MLALLLDLGRRRWFSQLARIGTDMPAYLRFAYIGAGLESGFFDRIEEHPGTREELSERLGIADGMERAFQSWLDAGVAYKVLSERRGVYSLRGRSIASLLEASNDPFRALRLEAIRLDHDLVINAPRRLLSGDQLLSSDLDGPVITRASRMGEPWIRASLKKVIPPSGPLRVLEVGCGTGAHLATLCSINPEARALGIDIDEEAAALAATNIANWGLENRVSIEVADVLSRSGERDFDLVTLHQNIYYFADEEQRDVLAHLREFLTPGGRILITSIMRNSGPSSAALDLWGAFTRGAARLPRPDDLVERLEAAGFTDVACARTSLDGVYWMATGRSED